MTDAPASPYPQTRVTAEDWLDAAQDVLARDGVGAVKILTLAERLAVSRSSFYWYFKSRDELLDRMLETWRAKNTPGLVRQAAIAETSINRNVLRLAECWFDRDLFDPALDFAIREWARRSPEVRAEVDAADTARVAAIRDMFARHGYAPTDAFIRARILYFTQIGYYALDVDETPETRIGYAAAYLQGFTGMEPSDAEIDGFVAFIRRTAVPAASE